jgi:hypothetical protein
MSHVTTSTRHDSAHVCSHVWIDPCDAPIARAPYSPVIGSRRREMKAGEEYRCQNCDATMIARSQSVTQPPCARLDV